MTDQPTNNQPAEDQPSTPPPTFPAHNWDGPPPTGTHTGNRPTPDKPSTTQALLRWIPALVAALVALVAIGAYNTGPEDSPYADVRDSIEAIDDANNERTEGAPQQEVVNGWTTIEYLNLLSTQQEEQNNRRDFLLLLIALTTLATFAAGQVRPRRT